jgi:hypothetical protein
MIHPRPGGPRAPWLLIGMAALSATSRVEAQGLSDVFRQGPGPAAPQGDGYLSFLVIRLLLLVVIALIAFLVSFRFIFPRQLERAIPRWPIEAYGLAWAWFVGLTGLALLGLFWPEWKLTIWVPSLLTQVPAPVKHYVLKLAIVLLTVLLIIASRTMYRSEAKAKYSPAPPARA